MRMLHTSDWHLGRRLHGADLSGASEAWVDHVATYADTWDLLRRDYLERPWDPELGSRETRDLFASRETLHKRLKRAFSDERLRLVAGHPFLAEGHDLRNVPAWQGVTAYVEQRFGAWTVPGGLAALGRAMAERAAGLGAEVVELPSDRVAYDYGPDERRAYVEAKATLAVVVASAAKRHLQPIAPSADWRVDLAEGCPAHCAYCYLAGSLKGPPITRVYANLPEIFDELPKHLGLGKVTSRSKKRMHEGTTYESSCYTDPLALEHLTGSWRRAVEHFGLIDPLSTAWPVVTERVGFLTGATNG